MEDIIHEIRRDFSNSYGKTDTIYPIKKLGKDFPAWVIRLSNGDYGVAIPYNGEEISEEFNEISFESQNLIIENEIKRLLVLSTGNEKAREQFSAICFSLVDPGKDGQTRMLIDSNPFGWWKEWKDLVGNSSVDKKPYDIIGELVTVRELIKKGYSVDWGGPDSTTKDISTELEDFEVKSTVSRYQKKVKIHGQFQLQPNGKPLYLVFNRFEKQSSGESINSLVKDLVENYDQNEFELEKKLRKVGYKKGKAVRNEKYQLLEQYLYPVNSNFPQITNNSFVDGKLPEGIESIEYTVDLALCSPISFDDLN